MENDGKQNFKLYLLLKNNYSIRRIYNDNKELVCIIIQIENDRENNKVCLQLTYANNILYSSISVDDIIYKNSNFGYVEKYKEINIRDIKKEISKIADYCRRYVITDENKEFLVENKNFNINNYKNTDAVLIEDQINDTTTTFNNETEITHNTIKKNTANRFAMLAVE